MSSLVSTQLVLAAAQRPLTREIFGNVPGWAQALFYMVAAVAVAAWVYGIVRRVRLWRQGAQSGTPVNWPLAIRRLVRDVIFQYRVCGRGAASVAHVLLVQRFLRAADRHDAGVHRARAGRFAGTANRATRCFTRASISASTNS